MLLDLLLFHVELLAFRALIALLLAFDGCFAIFTNGTDAAF